MAVFIPKNTAMTPNRLRYALLDDDRLIHISEAVGVLRAKGEAERYYCPGCSREVSIDIPTSSFKHNSGRRCTYESYVHNLAVLMLKKRFDGGDFRIGIKKMVQCREYKTCPFFRGGYECWGTEVKLYDLKTILPLCDYPSGGLDFTADLVLMDGAGKGKRPPVYIQVRTDYLAPLTLPPDILLIEVAVKDEEEAMRLGTEDIIEGGDEVHCQFLGPWKRCVI